nr:LysE family translocator [Rhodovibrio salinarum]
MGLFAVAALTPGPSNILIVETTIHRGQTAALFLAFGVSVGTCIWATATAAGTAALLAASSVYPVLVVVGATYLAKLAYDSFARAIASQPVTWRVPEISGQLDRGGDRRRPVRTRMLLKGVMTSLSNPKSALFWISVMSVAAKPDAAPWALTVFVGVCTVSALAIYGGFAVVFRTETVHTFLDRHRRVVFGVVGGLYLVFAGKVLTSGLF